MRSMDATLDGYAWLPRLLDTARLARAGELGDLVHPCPVDRRCMGLLGIDVATLHAIVDRERDDAGVISALRRRGIPTAQEAWFDAPAFEAELQRTPK
jgi:hypothetical protein